MVIAELSLSSPQSALLDADHEGCIDRSQTIESPPIAAANTASNRKIKFQVGRRKILPNEQRSTGSICCPSAVSDIAHVIFAAHARTVNSRISNSFIRHVSIESIGNIAPHQQRLVQALRYIAHPGRMTWTGFSKFKIITEGDTP